MLIDMTKSLMKPKNILLTLKEHNGDNVTTIRQVYSAKYAYKRSQRGSRTEMHQLMVLLECDNYYIRWSRYN